MNRVRVDILEISSRLKNISFPEFDLIVGISSGGIVPACLLAFQFQKPLKIIRINYRDSDNKPKFKQPQLLEKFDVDPAVRKILLVDDVSVTGSTLTFVKDLLKNHRIITFTLKGKADFVLFPEISSCVDWPWKV